jgi:hypothetical protein
VNFKLEIERMRECFEHNRPVKFRLPRPWWMFADDELSKIYTDKEILLEHGKIYYSYLLQANVKLFQKFPPFDYPAQIVYSTASDIDNNPLLLKDTIEEIYSYKYSNEDPPNKLVEIVENIRNEKDRTAFSVECQTDSTKLVAKMQTIMVYRKHLPMRILMGSILPVIACPEECDSVIILPSEYWSNEFKESWLTEL